MHHEHRRALAKNGQPAQPDQRVQAHIARAFMGSRQAEHDANVAVGGACKQASLPLAPDERLRETTLANSPQE
ncbi:MAG TPA: hypothetical protein VGH13_10595 [Xanthobacteraceae bacterium]